jgi:hypothetical protein
MASFDYTDFYILDSTDTKFQSAELIEDDIIRNIIQKYQMIIFTTKNDVLGNLEFGGDLLELLYETKISAKAVEESLNSQLSSYIPEINDTPYKLTVAFEQDPVNYQDVMFIFFSISEYEVVNQIGRFS